MTPATLILVVVVLLLLLGFGGYRLGGPEYGVYCGGGGVGIVLILLLLLLLLGKL